MKNTPWLKGIALAASISLIAAACSGGGEGENNGTNAEGSDQTITWWHNSNSEPGKGFYEDVAKDFEDANPGVKIQIEALQHEDMLTKLEASFQSGDLPDIYMERGGGELADHVSAGLTKDLSELAKDTIGKLGGNVGGWQIDGKTYGLPFSMGVVGFWYNKSLFAEAGIDTPPTTMTEFYDAVDKLKAAGIEPVSVGAGDKWPAAHYWYYTALRQCPQDTLQDSVTSLDFTAGCFLKAGETLEEIVAKEPFNAGFLSTPAQSGPTSASGLLATGKVAMELAGHWEPGVMQGLTEDNQGLGEDTGWFAFPAVEGGEGDPAAQLGGGDAWSVAESAPDVAVKFVEYLLSDEVQKGFAELGMGLPTNPAASGSVADPALADLLQVRDEAPFIQLYFDTAFGTSIGGAMNDEIALVFAGQSTAADIVTKTQAAADAEK